MSRSGCDVQTLQMYSQDVRPISALSLRAKVWVERKPATVPWTIGRDAKRRRQGRVAAGRRFCHATVSPSRPRSGVSFARSDRWSMNGWACSANSESRWPCRSFQRISAKNGRYAGPGMLCKSYGFVGSYAVDMMGSRPQQVLKALPAVFQSALATG